VFVQLDARPDIAATATLASGSADSGPVQESTREHGLTGRELQVLRLVASALSNKAIARELSLSERTVHRHLSNIFSKISVSSRAAATAFVYEQDLL
jgi:DNA-binding NarL/FixJ family response regulator